jgi:radical SAM protein with 4Fe4S-binding SPASM domain
MSFDLFERVVEQFPHLEHLHLQGMGEPMLHPRFFDMVEHLVGRGVRVTTNTNLTVLSPRRAARCVSSGLETIHVSIDAPSAESYARIRVGSRLERVARNFAFLKEARLNADSALPIIKIVMVVMRQNLGELPAMVQLAEHWGCSAVSVQHLCHDFHETTLPSQYRPMRDFVDEQSLIGEDAETVARHFAAAQSTADMLGIELRLPRTEVKAHPADLPGRERCDWPWRGAYVSYQGYSMPCCMISTPDRLTFGNLADRSAEQIWNSEAYNDFRNQLSSDQPPELCRSCAVYKGVF